MKHKYSEIGWRFFLFCGHMSFYGPLTSPFWTSGDVSSGFQSQSGQPYSHLAEAYVMLKVSLFSFDVWTAVVEAASLHTDWCKVDKRTLKVLIVLIKTHTTKVTCVSCVFHSCLVDFYFSKKFKAYVKNIPKKSHRCPKIAQKNKIKKNFTPKWSALGSKFLIPFMEDY